MEVLDPTRVRSDSDSWGIDHGTWRTLVDVLPDGDVPVVQLSVNASKPSDYHVGLGRRLPTRKAAPDGTFDHADHRLCTCHVPRR